MNIVLKNIQVNERLSEETNCFSATIYIDNVRAGEASNRGHGGNTDYRAFDARGQKLIHDAEEYCKGLPPKVYPGMGKKGRDVVIKMDLEHYIDNLVMEHLTAKDRAQFNKKLENHIQNNIVVGNENSFRVWSIKMPIKNLVQDERRHALLREFIEGKVVPNLKEGESILNTNLGDEFVKTLPTGKDRIVPQRPPAKQSSQKRDEDQGTRRGPTGRRR